MRFILLFISLAFLVSCGRGDQKICECLRAGDDLNKLSAKLLESEVTPATKAEMKRLRQVKELKCKDFETMGGEEMLKRKSACDLSDTDEAQNEEMLEIAEQLKR